MPVFSLTHAWLLLLGVTAITFWIGEGGFVGHSAMLPVLLLFGLTFVKGLVVILEFLELRHAPALWRWLVIGWLTLVLCLILQAYWISLP